MVHPVSALYYALGCRSQFPLLLDHQKAMVHICGIALIVANAEALLLDVLDDPLKRRLLFVDLPIVLTVEYMGFFEIRPWDE